LLLNTYTHEIPKMVNPPEPARLIRLPDWPERLAACIAEQRHRSFAWGEHDCCQFVARAIEAMTGVNPLATISYQSAKEALRLLRVEQGLLGAVTQRLGASKSVRLAMRGDVVLLAGQKRDALGIVTGEEALFASRKGLASVTVLSCRAAWQV
jgi:hypothetical protein